MNTDETITISSRLGNRISPIDQTISITRDGKEIKITDVAVENWVTILGRTQNDTFTPVFMFVHAKSIQPKNQYVGIGTVTGITKNSLTLQPRSQAEEKTITITTKTVIEQPDGEELELSDISEDIAVLITGYETETTTEAVTIRLLAQPDQDE